MKINNGGLLKSNFYIFLVVTLVCYGYSVAVRYEQKMVWEETPSRYFIGETPMMTTLDSYYWLRLAREFHSGTTGKNDPLRNFPDGKNLEAPIISILIAAVAPLFNDNFHKAGFYLMMVLSGLFIFPLAVYFYSMGYPMAGFLGGLIGTISYEYLIRTGIGRVDTDALILFFPFLIAVLLLKASQARAIRFVLIYSFLAGAAAYLLTEWWGKSAFVLPFAGTLFLAVLFNQPGDKSENIDRKERKSIFRRLISWRHLLTSFLAMILFIVCAIGFETKRLRSLEFVSKPVEYIEQYIGVSDKVEISETNKITFPNVLRTITETKRLPIKKSLGHLLRSPTLSAIGLIGFLIFLIGHWKKLIPLLPVFVVGLLVFHSARRFGVFLGPFVGIGYGYLLTILLAFIYRQIPMIRRLPARSNPNGGSVDWSQGKWSRLNELPGYGIALVFFLVVSLTTATGHIPKPSVPPQNIFSFLFLKDNLPKDSAIYTWWDYGYALTETTNRATFHDGGSQTSPKTYFIAKSFVSDSQSELYNTISYLASEGAGGIYQMIDEHVPDEDLFETVLANPPVLSKGNVFVVYTKDLMGKYGAINSIGRWDSVKQRPGPRTGYRILKCNQLKGFELLCQGRSVNLIKESSIGGIPLKQTVIIDDGYVKRRIQHSREHGKYLQILVKGRKLISVQIVSKRVFFSNFNQMFLLGKYDETLFKQYYNAFPWTRVFQARSNGQPNTDVKSDSI
jgi:dolichyl-diphosphooligosaccharide--protein glycosyltransferase